MSSGNATTDYLEILAKNANQIVFAYDIAANQFSRLNPAFEKIWGRTKKSVQANPVSLLKMIHPDDKLHVQHVYEELVEGSIIKNFEFRIQLRDRTERWLCVQPLLLEDEHVILGYADDITASKQYNDTLKKFSDKKNSILNILSHDLAGPLSMIQSLSKELTEDLKANDLQEVQKIIDLIERSSQQGVQLLQEFIRQEFLESANAELIKRRVDLVAALTGIMEEYQQAPLMVSKKFQFVAGSDRIYLDLDDSKFMQVINNLLSNAIKFTPDGGEITVALAEKEATVLITVADNGVGIPAKHHATLFEKFTRARRPGIKGEPSVGLGMSIIKTIVEWHHGQIWFESQEKQRHYFLH